MNEIEQLAGQVREAQLEIRSLKSKLLGVMEGNGISASAIVGSVAGSGYSTVQDEGTPLTQRTAINFVGAGVVAADSGGVTTVTISGGVGTTIATDPIWDALGDTVYGTGADTGAKLAGNITTTRKFLRQLGNGAVSAAPAWDTLVAGDIPSLAASYVAVGASAGGDLGGTYPNPTVNATHSGSAHHAAVTLSAAADTVLGLSTQQITLDTQTANLVWAGPTSGGAATPTFRALVAADMPSGVVDLTAINFLVGTATGLLSAEIVVGTTPGGELGGTWVSPTVDATHSGSAHHTQGHVMLDSTNHTDTLTGTVVRGDLVVGNSTPAWGNLAVGASGTVLIGGTDPAYSATPTVTSLLATTALIIGAATTAGARLDINAGVLELREGDDSAYADAFLKNLFVENVLSSGYLRLAEISSPTTPAVGLTRVYAATGSTLHFLTSAAVDGRVILTTDTDYVDLTDGGATTLHSHAGSGSVATDTIWDAAGDLVQGTGANTAARLAPVADAVVQYNGSTLVWTGSPELTSIEDTGGAERIFLDPSGGTYATPITLTGDTAVTTALCVGPSAAVNTPTAGVLGAFENTTTGAGQPATQIGLWASIGTGVTATTNGLIGMAGKAVMHTQTTSTLLAGLDFLVGFTTFGATVKTLANMIAVRTTFTGATATGLTITNLFTFDLGALSYTGLVAITNSRVIYARGGANTKIGTHRGVMVDSQTATVTANNPFYDTGLASTRDADGNRFRSNTQFGSVTGAFATGDGMLGIANAVTAPSTTPAGGVAVFAADAQRLMMRGIYAVNETIHSTLTALAAGTAYASSTTETALNNGEFSFPANSLVVGGMYRLTLRGVISTLTATAPTMQVRVRWGGVAGVLLGDSGAVTQGLGTTDLGWKVEFLIRVVSIGATGTLECQGEFVSETTAVLSVTALMQNNAVITIDSTAAKLLTVTGTWSANNAANSMTVRQYLLEHVG